MISNRRRFIQSAMATAMAARATSMLGATAEKRPNILLIFADQLAFDALSCVIGSKYVHTPNLDALAARGTRFSRAYAANPLCIPSRAAIFSGRYPVETGVETNDRPKVDPAQFPCMGTWFRKAGYRTGYFGKWHLAYPQDDVEITGFEEMATKMVDVDTGAHAVEFLSRKHDAPFFAVASFLNPHNICEWARGERMDQGDIGAPPPAAQCPPLRANHGFQKDAPEIMTTMREAYHRARMFPVGNWDDAKWRQYEWAYYRLVEKMDAQVGRLMQCLEEKDLAKDTLVMFLADHGDCEGAHHWNQKTVFYEESARVPLLMAWPGKVKHGVSDQLVNTGVDLLPTLCEFAGIKLPSQFPGLSLRGVATGKAHSLHRDFVVSSNCLAQGAPVDGVRRRPQGRMLRSDRYKYCVYSEGEHRESLVDLKNDPGEMVNLARDAKYKAVLKDHREKLRHWGAEFKDDFPYL